MDRHKEARSQRARAEDRDGLEGQVEEPTSARVAAESVAAKGGDAAGAVATRAAVGGVVRRRAEERAEVWRRRRVERERRRGRSDIFGVTDSMRAFCNNTHP